MAALSAARNTVSRPRAGRNSFIVRTSTTVYAGGLVGTDLDGYLIPYNNIATTRPCGIALETVVGNASRECRVNTEGVTITTTVAGGSTIATLNSLVYCQTDNPADCTTTAATSQAIGVITRYITGTTNEVTLFSMIEAEAKI
jgi:hypothetical protein